MNAAPTPAPAAAFPRSSGVLLHPTSLPGPHGSGDLGPAAYHFVDWLVGAGQSLWQILPLGGIGPGNSPYMSSSAFAGNVLLIDLAALQQAGWLSEAELLPDPAFSHTQVDYAATVPWRMDRLAQAAKAFVASPTVEQLSDFQLFCQQQADWLDDYALFMALADHHQWQEWCTWPTALARRTPDALAEARLLHADRVHFWQFCQWCFFRQWAGLKAYANQRGVRIIGDAPIFIAYQSAEVWARQELFELDSTGRPMVVAGVPPDAFSDTGQRWGNPLYRWTAHAAEGYAWWVQRIRRTFELVDWVRIDHFRGFAAHWEIPAEEPTAIHGRWVPGPGEALFSAITEALGPMPVIAEDLGVITPDVDALRQRFGLPGMRILQFAFGGGADNPYLPHMHRPDTVVYPGTHDNNTTLGWWEQAAPHEREHLRQYLGLGQEQDAEVHWSLTRCALASVANTTVLAMQDVLGLGNAARMNFPGHSEGYWAWRFEWQQVQPWHAERLRQWCRLYGRAVPADTPAP